MISTATDTWHSANQSYLTAALRDIKVALNRYRESIHTPSDGPSGLADAAEPARSFPTRSEDRRLGAFDEAFSNGSPAALDALCASFGLSPFEKSVLLLCAGIEFDSGFASLCAAAHGDPARNYPTFSLALALFADAHWTALTPDGPLRRWRLIEVGTGPPLTVAPLRIDERVLHYLAGVPRMDERLDGMVEPLKALVPADLAPSHAELARSVAALWTAFQGREEVPVIQLCGANPGDCRAVAAAAAETVGLRAAALPCDLIPGAAAELNTFIRLWEREATLSRSVLVVECDVGDIGTRSEDLKDRVPSTNRLIEGFGGLLIVLAREPRRIPYRSVINIDVHRPTPEEQGAAWHALLGTEANPDPSAVNALASQFSLGYPTIRSVSREAMAQKTSSPNQDLATIAWRLCRTRCRTRLDGLAQRIEPVAGWDDIVLPGPQMQALRQIAVHVRYRATVYHTWGFAAKSARGLGITALFAGVSGTGKTIAAEVLANDLHLDLYRIDLASTVSKYIGETEKNLRGIFDAAEESGAILLFDEADALFGKRSEVKDSHDRYANIEVSYLLQRVEAYRGLAILTTNMKQALDPAFLRRIRFVIQFPFPDIAQRAEIWRRIFPAVAPVEGLDVLKLAKLNIPGGNIWNVAANASFLAADAGEPVRMHHLLAAARSEYAKLERPMTESETAGFV
jgi:ATPase family associated with various cellular activities (AAA)